MLPRVQFKNGLKMLQGQTCPNPSDGHCKAVLTHRNAPATRPAFVGLGFAPFRSQLLSRDVVVLLAKAAKHEPRLRWCDSFCARFL